MNFKNQTFAFLLWALVIGLFSCTTTPPADDELPVDLNSGAAKSAISAEGDNAQRKLIEDYVKNHNLVGEFTPSGLFFAIEQVGSGPNPDANSVVKVEYTGYLLDGKKFDGTEAGSPIEFSLNGVVSGWTEGIPKFKKGGKGKLIIPSNLGYGPMGQGPIPGNAVLVFDIYLVDFK